MDALFEQIRDRKLVQMAAFTPDNPDDRQSFDKRMARALSSPDSTTRAITCDGRLVGSIASFAMDGRREVTYWIDRAAWGQHIASRALAQLLDIVSDRPLHARAASDNAASQRVLEKAGLWWGLRRPTPLHEAWRSRKRSCDSRVECIWGL
jgi:RimJ/RimL family protein N-acetyltransferase